MRTIKEAVEYLRLKGIAMDSHQAMAMLDFANQETALPESLRLLERMADHLESYDIKHRIVRKARAFVIETRLRNKMAPKDKDIVRYSDD